MNDLYPYRIALGDIGGWVLIFVPVTWAVIYLIAIRHEEAYLKEKFGSSYLEYMGSVRRWL